MNVLFTIKMKILSTQSNPFLDLHLTTIYSYIDMLN